MLFAAIVGCCEWYLRALKSNQMTFFLLFKRARGSVVKSGWNNRLELWPSETNLWHVSQRLFEAGLLPDNNAPNETRQKFFSGFQLVTLGRTFKVVFILKLLEKPGSDAKQLKWIIIPDRQCFWHLHCPNSLCSLWLSPLCTDWWHQRALPCCILKYCCCCESSGDEMHFERQ